MKNTCKCALREYLTERLRRARTDASLTQAQFAEKLLMDTRSYVCLEQGRYLCCLLTFVIYLAFFCKDVDQLVDDLREILLHVFEDQAS